MTFVCQMSLPRFLLEGEYWQRLVEWHVCFEPWRETSSVLSPPPPFSNSNVVVGRLCPRNLHLKRGIRDPPPPAGSLTRGGTVVVEAMEGKVEPS